MTQGAVKNCQSLPPQRLQNFTLLNALFTSLGGWKCFDIYNMGVGLLTRFFMSSIWVLLLGWVVFLGWVSFTVFGHDRR
jgi:hypothetical protein